MFFDSGAQPVDWQIPWTANKRPKRKRVLAAPIRRAVTTEASIPQRMTLRVPSLSPNGPQQNCPTASALRYAPSTRERSALLQPITAGLISSILATENDLRVR